MLGIAKGIKNEAVMTQNLFTKHRPALSSTPHLLTKNSFINPFDLYKYIVVPIHLHKTLCWILVLSLRRDPRKQTNKHFECQKVPGGRVTDREVEEEHWR